MWSRPWSPSTVLQNLLVALESFRLPGTLTPNRSSVLVHHVPGWAALHPDAVWTGPPGSVRRTCSVLSSHSFQCLQSRHVLQRIVCHACIWNIRVFVCVVGIHLSRTERKVLPYRYLNFLSLAKSDEGNKFQFLFWCTTNYASHNHSVFLGRKIWNLLW